MKIKDIQEAIFDIYLTSVKKNGISCRKCDALALPLCNSGNKYKCFSCGRQFTSSKHCISGQTIAACIQEKLSHDMLEAIVPTPPKPKGLLARMFSAEDDMSKWKRQQQRLDRIAELLILAQENHIWFKLCRKISNKPMDQITIPSGLLSCFLLIPLRGQEARQKQVVIGHRGR